MNRLLKATKRENILVLLFSFVLVGFLYYFFRMQSLQLASAYLGEQYQSSERDTPNLKRLTPDATRINQLNTDIAALKATIAAEQVTLTGLKKSFVDLARDDAVPVVREAITALADRTGMRILRIQQSSVTLDKLTDVSVSAEDEILQRPQFDVLFNGEFVRVNAFVQRLQDLDYSVVITRLSIKTDSNLDTTTTSMRLNASLTLAF